MSSLEQMKENVSFMKDFKPLDEREMKAVEKVREIFRGKNLIPCTGCRYCVDGCPKKISIPDLFACMNAKKTYQNTNSNFYYGTTEKRRIVSSAESARRYVRSILRSASCSVMLLMYLM